MSSYKKTTSRTTQYTLSTMASSVSSSTMGDQMRTNTSKAYKRGKPAPEFYRDWKRNYK